MNKHIFYHEKQKQFSDQSTASHDVDELGENHPIWEINKPAKKTSRWFSVMAIPACIWAALAWLNAQYNIGQGDLKPHSWELMNAATAVLFMYWSAKLFEWIVNKDYKYEFTKIVAAFGGGWLFVIFTSSGLYLVKTIVELFIK